MRSDRVVVRPPGLDQHLGLIDDGEDAEFAAVVGAPFDEVIGPDVSRIFRPKPYAGSVVEPKPAVSFMFPDEAFEDWNDELLGIDAKAE